VPKFLLATHPDFKQLYGHLEKMELLPANLIPGEVEEA